MRIHISKAKNDYYLVDVYNKPTFLPEKQYEVFERPEDILACIAEQLAQEYAWSTQGRPTIIIEWTEPTLKTKIKQLEAEKAQLLEAHQSIADLNLRKDNPSGWFNVAQLIAKTAIAEIQESKSTGDKT